MQPQASLPDRLTLMAFSGAVLYSYYEYRLTQNEERVAKFTEGFEEQYNNAIGNIEAEREERARDGGTTAATAERDAIR